MLNNLISKFQGEKPISKIDLLLDMMETDKTAKFYWDKEEFKKALNSFSFICNNVVDEFYAYTQRLGLCRKTDMPCEWFSFIQDKIVKDFNLEAGFGNNILAVRQVFINNVRVITLSNKVVKAMMLSNSGLAKQYFLLPFLNVKLFESNKLFYKCEKILKEKYGFDNELVKVYLIPVMEDANNFYEHLCATQNNEMVRFKARSWAESHLQYYRYEEYDEESLFERIVSKVKACF